MNPLAKEELKTLMEERKEWCVSIYMPTHRMFPETKQDPIRFKNIVREAETRLTTAGLKPAEAKKLLEQGHALTGNGPFWQYQSDGLALFISPGSFHYYRLPLSFEQLLVVSDRFHIKPLLPLVTLEGKFYVLALSHNEVKLLQCTRYGVQEMEIGDAPRSLSEALRYDDPQKQFQFHTKAPAAGGERAAMFHGQGAGKDEAKENMLRFFKQVDRGLHAVLATETAPLVLAGVEYLLPIYREANSYRYLLEQSIAGNPEGLKPEDLREQAGAIVEPHFLEARAESMARYRQIAGTGGSSKDVREIIPAAREGKIDTLFVAMGVQRWGFMDSDGRTVHAHNEQEPGDEDLLDFAAVHVYLNGGTVYAVKAEEMPDTTSLAAIFRY